MRLQNPQQKDQKNNNQYPPRVWVKLTDSSDTSRVFPFYPASQPDVIPYLSKEEHDAIVKNLVEALEFLSKGCLVPPDGGQPTINDLAFEAKQALENYKKQTGEGK